MYGDAHRERRRQPRDSSNGALVRSSVSCVVSNVGRPAAEGGYQAVARLGRVIISLMVCGPAGAAAGFDGCFLVNV